MKNSLVSRRLKNGFYTGLAAGALLGSYVGCGDNPIEPPKPRLSQTATLENFIDINYKATQNVSSSTRKTFYNGNWMSTETISTPNYSEIFQDRMKGDYMFVLEHPDAKPDTARVSVPNYMPTMNLSGLQTNLNKNDTLRLNLEGRLHDNNIEDNPIPLTNATPLDGKTQVSLSGYELTIISGETPGQYEARIDFGSAVGGLGQATITGTILPDQIAFWSNRPVPEGGYNEEIYLMNEDGTGIQRLTTHPGQDLEPTFSPDGKEIALTSHRTGGTAVWRMNADGSNQRDITSNIVERFRQAKWCSNGKIVGAYRDKGDSEAGIGIINPVENSFTPIYSQPNAGGIPEWPSWSPDCSEIVFGRYVNGNWDIWKMNSDGSGLVNLTNHPAVDGQPAWSPDGTKIAFFSDRDGSLDIHRMNSDGSNVIRLTNDPKVEADPAWSPTGNKIVFTNFHSVEGNLQLYIINSDGTGNWTQLTFDGANRYPALRPRQ